MLCLRNSENLSTIPVLDCLNYRIFCGTHLIVTVVLDLAREVNLATNSLSVTWHVLRHLKHLCEE